MAVPLGADSEFRWACPWGKIVHEWKTTNLRRMDDVQMGVASGWVGLSLRRVVGFGGRVRGVVNGLCHGFTDGNGWTARKWKSLRAGWACPCGGFWISAGVSVGGKPSTNTLRVRCENHEFTNRRCANGSRFGLGGLVPAAGSGFWRARLWGGKPSTNENHDDEWTMCKWESLRAGWACPCGGFWVLAGVAVGSATFGQV